MTDRARPQRVLADGWGPHASGSVFCEDSSLRYIYEQCSEAPVSLTSLAGPSAGFPSESGFPASTMDSRKLAWDLRPLDACDTATLLDELTYGGPEPDPHAAGKCCDHNPHGTPRNHPHTHCAPAYAAPPKTHGVDLFEAAIAKACANITRQLPDLPHSFRECSVCLSSNAYAQLAPCGHTFHSKCFLRWFRTSRCCPLCRASVESVQLAPVPDDIDALIADMDQDSDPELDPADDSLDVDVDVTAPLMDHPELLSLLTDFDTDMDGMALDDDALEMPLKTLDEDPTCAQDIDMDMDMGEPTEQEDIKDIKPVLTPPPMQFEPTSTMPNYWNVLNQGLAPPQSEQEQQPLKARVRMVHIAPKPNNNTPHIATAVAPPAPAPTMPFAQMTPYMAGYLSALEATASSRRQRAAAPEGVSCRCTGGCRNGRCACVKDGAMCGAACRCTSCKNPFVMVKAAGADIDVLLKDACFMHNVAKTRDMVQRMDAAVIVPCCQREIKVVDCLHGYTCAPCGHTFDFSWCLNKLLDHDRTPRNHCAVCKRCCDHRDVHCEDCGRCYFAGVTGTMPCPCKDSSRRRRERLEAQAAAAAASGETAASTARPPAPAKEDDEDGECAIM